MRRAYFKVVASPGTYFEPGVTEATVEIVVDGALGTFTVKPYKKKRSATLTLEEVAKSVLQKVASANAGVPLEAPKRRGR